MIEILFINPTRKLALNQEVNGTMLLATKLLQAGFETDILRFGQVKGCNQDYSLFITEMTDRIIQIAPKCVSFYTLWPDYHVMLRIAKEVKKRNKEIYMVFGGPQSSVTAKDTITAMEFVDFICTGEGENVVVPFFEAVLRNNGAGLEKIPGLYYRKNGEVVFNDMEIPLCDLNALPYWDDRLYLKNSEPNITSGKYWMPIDVGRGCPFSCTFCCSSRFWRRAYRLKSPERIIQDIHHYNEKFGIKNFLFSHDAFTVNRKLISDICDRIIESGLDITWKCTARIDCITEELVLKMKQAGLTQIEFGIETGSQRMQKLINKKLELENAKKMVAFLLKNKIDVGLFFMYGFPEETEQDLNETLELLFSFVDMGVSYTSMSFCLFNPTTVMTEKYYDQLVFDPDIKILTRQIFGHAEEVQVIKDNKAIFPFFYHLNTPLRNEYQHLRFLVNIYRHFPNSMRYLRKLYNGDNLKFYRDFYHNNFSCFEDPAYIIECIRERPLEMLDNMMKDLDVPNRQQLRALMKFDFNAQKVFSSTENVSIQETYDFRYVDFKLKLPLEQFGEGQTEILLEKVNGVKNLKIVRIG